MNAKDVKPILRELQKHFPGYVGHKRMLLHAPMSGLLRAVLFEPSGFAKLPFSVETCVLPLYFPNDYVSLLFGHRLRHETRGYNWSLDMPDLVPGLIKSIQEQAMPMLASVVTLDGFLALARTKWRNTHTPKFMAFAMARAGQYQQAIETIDAFIPSMKPTTPWEQDIIDILTRLRDLIHKDPAAAQQQLNEWENHSLKTLQLEAFR